MVQLAGSQEKSSLDSSDLANFPCTDLKTIDTLWVKYSRGRFGFSVQQQIWQSVQSNSATLGGGE